MSKENIICDNCGENTDSTIFDCIECSNILCDKCANVCNNCASYLCDNYYDDHKKSCN